MSDWREHLGDRRVVASISGGKDSAAMSLWLREQGVEHDRVFMDTGWEHQATYEYLRGVLTRVLGPITEIRGERTMVELVRHKGMFPGRLRRFCTQELKVFPMQRHLKSIEGELVNAVGIRRAESAARAAMPEWEWSDGFDCEVWRPIIEWTADDVRAIHLRHGLPPNPLYLAGASRVGCWPCIYARKAEIRLVADTDPARIDTIRALESELGDAMQARADAKGKTLATRPAWFASRLGRKSVDPIDKVVEWSRTTHGGKQFEMFAADPSDAGCMRWGLCETDTIPHGPGSASPGPEPQRGGPGVLPPGPPPPGQDAQGGILPVGLGTGFGLAGARTDRRSPPPEAGKGGILALRPLAGGDASARPTSHDASLDGITPPPRGAQEGGNSPNRPPSPGQRVVNR